MSSEHFVLPFKTRKSNYIYDVNSNSIIAVNDELNKYFCGDSSVLSDSTMELLDRMKQDGFLLPNPIEKIHHTGIDNVESLLERKVSGITFQVTQQCNLKCKYCLYSGDYAHRHHSVRKLDFETLQAGVEFVLRRSHSSRELNFGFYGGEPLLNFKLIKDAVAFIKKRCEGKTFYFNMTTNGTVFNDENLSFLDENDFRIMISLDGPKEQHDRNRVFAATGGGTYDIIMSNVEYIREKYPNLLRTLVFSAVIDPSQPDNCANEFFFTSKDIDGIAVNASVVSSDYRISKNEVSEEYIVSEETELFKVYMHKLGRLKGENISQITFEKFAAFKRHAFTHRPRTSKLPSICHHGGPCTPGQLRLFLNAEGKFFPCEKVSEVSMQTCIGTIENGFDVEQIKSIMNIGLLSEDRCKKCWGIRTCGLCLAHVDDGESLSPSKKRVACDNMLEITLNTFLDYCMLNEFGYKFENDEYPVYTYGV